MERDTRLEAFSDGVFAIAITLLILDVKIPPAGAGSRETSRALWSSLEREWPAFFALVTSFFSVLIMWMHHHMVFRLVRCSDTRLLFSNGVLLLFITVVPFPTALISEYLGTPAAPVACEVYAGVFLGISVAFQALLRAAFRDPVREPGASRALQHRLRRNYWMGPPGYLLAMIAAPFSPWTAMGICTALWILWAVTTRECDTGLL